MTWPTPNGAVRHIAANCFSSFSVKSWLSSRSRCPRNPRWQLIDQKIGGLLGGFFLCEMHQSFRAKCCSA
jgi:hypothetical protein